MHRRNSWRNLFSKNVQVKPNQQLSFQLDVPEPGKASLAFRVHVDWDGDGATASGDLLTTQVIAVPRSPESAAVQVPVTLI